MTRALVDLNICTAMRVAIACVHYTETYWLPVGVLLHTAHRQSHDHTHSAPHALTKPIYVNQLYQSLV